MINLVGVSKRFDRNFVVSNVSLMIKKGEVVGFLGPNGAGKTTTLRMLAGVLPPSKGTIEIDQLTMEGQGRELKNRIGYLPENNPLYDEMTVEEALQFWSSVKHIPTVSIAAVVAKTGIREVYYRPIGQLSKGYRQRVGLAQALLGDPEILILDEPTEGLDPNQRHDIQTLVKTLGRNHTVIISSHVLGEIAQMCTRIVIIHKGAIVADSPPQKLKVKSQKSKIETVIIEAEITGVGVLAGLKKNKDITNITESRNNYFVITATSDIREVILKLANKEKWHLLTLLKKEQGLEEVFRELTHE